MAPVPSRKPEASAPLHSGGCPRCGTRLAEAYKYCPNCAYRLRPDVLESPTPQTDPPTTSERLLALGGYLAFASLLLLVAYAGIQIFIEQGQRETEDRVPLEVPRDPNCLRLDRTLFREVAADAVAWGLYRYSPEEGEWDPASLLHTRVDDSFLLAITETTHDQYYAFLLARAKKSGQSIPERFYPASWKRSTGSSQVRRIYDIGAGNHPVTEVDFAAALEFCAYVWEEVFESDPDLVVDLPTAQEFVLAGRRDRIEFNFPWGTRLSDPEAKVVLRGRPLAVRDPAVGEYGGFFALVGNVAEWVHVGRVPAAAGWSYRDFGYRAAWEEGWTRDMRTPFSQDGFERLETGPAQAHVGFRVAVRRAPAEPSFVTISKGTAHHTDWNNPVLPPPVNATGTEFPEELPSEEAGNLPPVPILRADEVVFASMTRTVIQEFEISGLEITNRQYLAFLGDVAARSSSSQMELADLYPGSFSRENPFARVEPVYHGHYDDPRKVRFLYEAGRENYPAEGVKAAQARAYAEWLSRKAIAPNIVRLPTVGEYLRAGRGDGTSPYPQGVGASSPEIICTGRTGDEVRAASLLGYFERNPTRPVGLVGNVLEYVVDDLDERVLLAGGCYFFPEDACALDSFLDPEWGFVDAPEEILSDVGIEVRPRAVTIGVCAGFRVVRVARIL